MQIKYNDFKYLIICIILYSSSNQAGSQDYTANIEIQSWSAEGRDSLVNALTNTRDGLLHELQGLSEEQWLFRESEDRWSIAELVEHLEMQDYMHYREVYM